LRPRVGPRRGRQPRLEGQELRLTAGAAFGLAQYDQSLQARMTSRHTAPTQTGRPADARLRDGWGRSIRSLRVSVTDRCNFRCRYCMPAEGLAWLPKPDVLTFEEIQRIVRVMAAIGVCDVRLPRREP